MPHPAHHFLLITHVTVFTSCALAYAGLPNPVKDFTAAV
ncbi:hypothetical protein yaldo0001_4330 [Yersinia aldovae ATCC 35236]|nr:hypothetical protein yaldo0001_4330 [Yersinia aldovae ATCC 35236]